MFARVLVFALTVAASGVASAQYVNDKPAPAASRTGFYLYGSVGQSNGNDRGVNTDRATAAVGTVTSKGVDTKNYSGRVGIGYRFNQYFGIEGGYVDVGRTEINFSGTGGEFQSKASLRGAQAALVGFVPVSDNLDALLKFGGVWTQTKYEDSTGLKDTSSNVRSYWGLGLQYHFTPNLFGRFEFERYSSQGSTVSGKNDYSQYQVGVGWIFN
jgi:OOP family OmpA-OmpF porin